ncbi:hypothetical protein [Synechococcus phage BUCT-ZZ01]|nr:hypothetical protein [Synechococcus phage BUCT-ZZ01]
MKQEILVGIAGPARAGKNEVAKYLQKYHAFHEDSFAAPIRKCLMDILGLPFEEYERVKQEPQAVFGGKTCREFMQKMGTEFGREMIYDDIWVDSCILRLDKFERAAISDVRFDNEAKAIKERGGFIIHVDRPGIRIEQSAHLSEKGIDESLIDFKILNDSGLDNLYAQIETTMRQIFKRM